MHEPLSEHIPANLWLRVFALIVDLSLVSVVMIAAFMVLMAIDSVFSFVLFSSFKEISSVIILAIIFIGISTLAALFIWHFYFIYFEKRDQATPGKKIFDLKVISLRGGDLSTKQIVIRDFYRYIDVMLMFPALIAIALTKRSQRCGDLAAETMVIETKRATKKEEKNSW